MDVFSPFYLLKLLKRKRLKAKLSAAHVKTHMIQKEANKIMEGVNMDPAYTYARIIKIYLQNVFFIPLLPITPWIALGAILINFWVQKYVLLRRAARPASIGFEITETCIFLVRLTPLVLGVSIYHSDMFNLCRWVQWFSIWCLDPKPEGMESQCSSLDYFSYLFHSRDQWKWSSNVFASMRDTEKEESMIVTTLWDTSSWQNMTDPILLLREWAWRIMESSWEVKF